MSDKQELQAEILRRRLQMWEEFTHWAEGFTSVAEPASELGKKEQCGECQFFHDVGGRMGKICRWRPPVVQVFDGEPYSCSPSVGESDWCGRFLRIVPPVLPSQI